MTKLLNVPRMKRLCVSSLAVACLTVAPITLVGRAAQEARTNPDISAIPGGGYRTEKSRLVERYRLMKDGALLSVTFTWTDPTVFRTPHSYEYRYHRLPATYEPRQWLLCDPYDEERAKFLDPPRPA